MDLYKEITVGGYVTLMVVYSVLLLAFGMMVVARKSRVPGRAQNAVEIMSEGLRGTFMSALGPGGEKHLPLIYGLFWYIIFCNLIELIPIFHAVTANTSNTIGLGIIVFFYSQYIGIKSKGVVAYLKHFVGPMLILAPLLLPIEIIGEIIKPFTLGMRLFGNIYAEDVMHALASPPLHDVTTAEGTIPGLLTHPLLWLMVPVQVVVIGLQTFTGVIQAYIFALLSCAYIGLMAEHHDDHGDNYNGHPHSEDTTEKLAESLGAHTAARVPAG